MEKPPNPLDDNFNLLDVLAKGKPEDQLKARVYILEKNISLNSFPVSGALIDTSSLNKEKRGSWRPNFCSRFFRSP
jgi:type II restriction/modification system DNA methylase subunit YeeA